MLVPAFDMYGLFLSAVGIAVLQIVFFIFASAAKTDKLTDLSYGLTFIIMALLFLFGAGVSLTLPRIIVAAMVVIWGGRLAGYLFYRILKIGKDDRFDGIREKFLSFAAFWLLQCVTIWIVLLPVTVSLSPASADSAVTSAGSAIGLGFLSWLGIAVWLVGFIIEAVADAQKFTFRNDPANRGRWIESGIWRLSRHPNYFGEMLIWWGIFLTASYAFSGLMWLTAVGPLFLTFLLLFVSGVPKVEQKADQKYGDQPAYNEYKRRTSLLIPLPPKKR